MILAYVSNSDPEGLLRKNNFPLWKKVIAHRISHLPKYRPAIYSLGDENGVSRSAGYGPSDQVYFRKFLQEKYQTIQALNYNWKSSYASFDDVPHPGSWSSKDQEICTKTLDTKCHGKVRNERK